MNSDSIQYSNRIEYKKRSHNTFIYLFLQNKIFPQLSYEDLNKPFAWGPRLLEPGSTNWVRLKIQYPPEIKWTIKILL